MNLTKEEAKIIQEELDILLLVNPPKLDKEYPWTSRENAILNLIKQKFSKYITTALRGTYEYNILLNYMVRDGLISQERYEKEYAKLEG